MPTNHQVSSLTARNPMQRTLSGSIAAKRSFDVNKSDSEEEDVRKKKKKPLEEEDEDMYEFEFDENSGSDEDDGGEDSDGDYEEPTKKGKENGRSAFSKALRIEILSKAPQNKDGHYVCPPCGMPLMEESGVEIKTYIWVKPNPEKGRTEYTKKYMVAGQLDHNPPWAGRYEKLLGDGATPEEIREDHDDPNRLRPLCLRCNTGHQFERKKLPSYDYSDEQYESEDEDRDKEIWKRHRK